jgi:hypothetical protein
MGAQVTEVTSADELHHTVVLLARCAKGGIVELDNLPRGTPHAPPSAGHARVSRAGGGGRRHASGRRQPLSHGSGARHWTQHQVSDGELHFNHTPSVHLIVVIPVRMGRDQAHYRSCTDALIRADVR